MTNGWHVFIVRSETRCDRNLRWAAKAIRGHSGDSWSLNRPVLTKFASVIWYSFALASFVLDIIIAIPAAAARKQYSAKSWNYTITVIALVGISLPSFFVATLLKWVFSEKASAELRPLRYCRSVTSRAFPPDGPDSGYGMAHCFSVITLTIVSIGALMRYTRTNMLEDAESGSTSVRRARRDCPRSVSFITTHSAIS